ncbi:MAG: ATP-binding protein [Acidobacteria bacterium]|nr:ATP-binding protein [Acidobacteriota bacterium]
MVNVAGQTIPRLARDATTQALGRSPVVAIVGPRQCGKTTLARQLVAAGSANYFDLEDPVSLGRLDEPLTALRDLSGIVVIDEVQHRPDLFPILRVLADREGNPARFLVLGSAGPNLLRQSAESLAGRIEYIELTGFQVSEVGVSRMDRLWVRGGFPRSFLAGTEANSLAWRRAFVRTLVERDLPQFGAQLSALVVHRLLAMVAHYHGQVLNVAELAAALNVSQGTVRRYLDLLHELFLIRQLRPWHENLGKRQVRRPRVYIRDSGLYHHLIGVGTMDALRQHPRIGASWEGFILEKVIAEALPDETCFWATHNGAELDLLLMGRGARVGVEIKRVDAPRRTRSMAVAVEDLRLDALYVVYPGDTQYPIDDRITAIPATMRLSPFDPGIAGRL